MPAALVARVHDNASPVKILFSVSHFGFLRNFEHGLLELARRGHTIHLLADRRENMGGTRTLDGLTTAFPEAFTWSYAPSPKGHVWHQLGISLRQCLDYWRYLDPIYDQARALRRRAAGQVPALAVSLPQWPLVGRPPVLAALRSVVRSLERIVPPPPFVDQVLTQQTPDLVVVTPLLYFGSQQVDYVRGARQRGIPTALCVGSWDHLTTKGLIHEIPDGVTVWNDAQRDEAGTLHGVPREIVRVTGAQAYDHWFRFAPTMTREEFLSRVGLPAGRPMLLYLCSSPFIAPHEVGFVRRWLEGLRQHSDAQLRSAAILIRPHPQNADQWAGVDLEAFGPVAIWPRGGSNPVDQAARSDYYHSMYFSVGVVGVNTSALIESGIVGRPVFTVRAEEFAGTQEGTLHFQHLKNVNGGLLTAADTLAEHLDHLSGLLADPGALAARGREFITAFIRPNGLDRPAAPIYADAVESVATSPRRPVAHASFAQPLLRALLYPAAALVHRARRRPARVEGDAPGAGALRILFVMGSLEYLRFFDSTLVKLSADGHKVMVAVNALRDPAKKQSSFGDLGEGSAVSYAGVVPPRGDIWGPLARAIRGTMDFVRFLDPAFADTPALRHRIKRKVLPRTLQWLDRVHALSRPRVRRVLAALALLERAIPIPRSVKHALSRHRPDVVLVSPLVDAASEQVDTVRAAQALRIPVGLCVASWDNLTNKGLLRVVPDFITVWNEHQRTEAVELHGVPADHVAVTGAQPFDRWFTRQPSVSRDTFASNLGLDPGKPIVLFTGSSVFISGHTAEVPFVRQWVETLRQSPEPLVREANILIRPHPYNADQWVDADFSDLPRVAIAPRGRHNPTDEQNRNLFFDSLFHAAAVVGVNTSAMIEAAILGKPVHAITGGAFSQTQEGTLHFRYLLPENGGFLRVSTTLEAHVVSLARSLTDPETVRAETHRFVTHFLRPHGLDQPAVPKLADAIVTGASRVSSQQQRTGVVASLLRLALVGPVLLYAALAAIAGFVGPVSGWRKAARLQLHRVQKIVQTAPRRLIATAAAFWRRGRKNTIRLAQFVWITGRRAAGWVARRILKVYRRTRYEVALWLRGADVK